MEEKHFVCVDLRVCLYHGKQHVTETPGQMWHKLASETTFVVPSDPDCAEAYGHYAVLGRQYVMH